MTDYGEWIERKCLKKVVNRKEGVKRRRDKDEGKTGVRKLFITLSVDSIP